MYDERLNNIVATILIIEDNNSLSTVFKFVLEKEGHTIEVAKNGREGLQQLKTASPDLILLDMLMPVMGGLEFLRKYDAHGKDKAPVIILSNLNEDQDVQKALKMGAVHYILKADTSPHQLIAHVDKELAKVKA
jgi:CheY-like chemotaxis protein